MKKQTSLLLLFINCSICIGQPIIQWQKSFGGSNVDQAFAVEQTADSGLIVAGISRSSDGDITIHHGTNWYNDYWIVKTDANGIIQWQHAFGGTFTDWLYSLKQTYDGGFILAGFTESADGDVIGYHGGGDCWLVKTDNAGILQWQNTYGGSFADGAQHICETTDGGLIFTGNTSSIDGDVTGLHGQNDIWVVKTNNIGILQWQKCYGGTQYERGMSIEQTNDGGFIIAGRSGSNDGDVTNHHGAYNFHDYWVVKTDSIGTLQWQNSYGGTLEDYPISITQTFDDGYIIAGVSYSNNGDVTAHHGSTDSADCWILKLDSTGIIQWQKSYGGTKEDYACSIKQTQDGGFIIAGASSSDNGNATFVNGLTDYWIIKTDSSGNIQWQKNFGGSLFDVPWDITLTSDGGYVIAGYSESNDFDVTGNHGDYDFWLVKLHTSVGIEESSEERFSDLPFPNPANDIFKIRNTQLIISKITIYNMMGNIIYSANDINSNEIIVDVNKWNDGIYFVKVVSGEKYYYKKIIVEHD